MSFLSQASSSAPMSTSMYSSFLSGGARRRNKPARKLRGGKMSDGDIGMVVMIVVFIVILLLLVIGAAFWNNNNFGGVVEKIVIQPGNCPAAPVNPPAPAPAAAHARLEVDELARAKQALANKAAPAVVFLHMDGCHHCKQAMPVFDKLPASFPGVSFLKLNAKNAGSLARENNVTGYPTFLTNFSAPIVGYRDLEAMKTVLRQNLNKAASAPMRSRAVVSPVSNNNNNSMKVREVSEDEAEKLLASAKKAVVFVFANWCGFCKKMAPVVDQVTADFPDITIVKLDADKAKKFTSARQVTGFPTFIRNYGATKKVSGYKDVDAFKKMLAEK